MKKKKKGKVRWLAVLLAGCLLLSIVPVTAFASEDTDPTKSENAVGEETQLTEQQNATEETKMGVVTPAPKDESKATDNGVSGTSAESKNDKAEDLQPSEQPDAEKKSASVDTSNSVIKKASVDANAENKTEKSDKSNEKSSAEVSTYAAEYDFLPSGVKKDTTYQHAYHTQVNVTANVSVKDSDGTVLETTQVNKSNWDFVKGNVSEVVETALASLQTEIETPYKAKGTVTRENGNGQLEFDHFESADLYTFTPTSGDSIPFADQEAAKQYFREHPDATGTFTTTLDVHEYQKYEYAYDLTVQKNSQQTNTITSATVQNVNFNIQPGDAPQATAEVPNFDTDKYEIAYECWQEFENNEPVAAWYSDNGSHGSLPTITEFESGKKYVYFVMLKQKNGYSFSSETAVTVNGESVKSSLSGEFLYLPAVKTITMPTIKVIDVVEVNDVTVSFKDGDKPVFTGKVPDGADYAFRCEWWSLDENTGIVSTEPEWGGDIYKNKITAFEAGKTYHYGVYVTAYTANISSNAKLIINGQEVSYTRIGSDGETQSFWVETNLTMMPQAGGTTPAEKYTVTYTDGVDGEEIFKDQTYTVEAGKATPAFSGTPAREGYKFAGWSPAVTDTVTGNVTYTAQWEKVATPAETFTVTYTDGVDNEEIFKDQTYTVESGKATPAFNGTSAREGYKFTGWSPAVTDTVTGNVTYTAQWEKVATPAETFTVTYTDGVDNEEIFKDQTYTVESGKATPAFNGTPTRKGYTFTGWKPAVAATVTGNATYEATWKTGSATTTPKDDKSNTGETTSPKTGDTGNGKNSTTLAENKSDTVTTPKTGDTSNIVFWIVLLFVSSGALVGAVVIVKKKKYNR